MKQYSKFQNAIEIAKAKVIIGNWVGIKIAEGKDDYEITIGNSPTEKYPYYPYSAKVLIAKKSQVLTKLLSASE